MATPRMEMSAGVVTARGGAARATTQQPQRVAHRYIPALDGLRAIAVLLVMLVHSRLDVGHGGWIGVDIFFVLSGYLITSILLSEWSRFGSISLRHFYFRRVLRLFPALVVFVVVTTAMALLFSQERSASETLLSALTTLLYTANWASALQLVEMGPFEHMWSLAIEEQFYLIWPPLLAILLARRIAPRAMMLVVGLLIVASLVTRAIIFNQVGEENPWRTYAGFDTRADSLLVGCLLAMAMSTTTIRPPAWLTAGLGAACFSAILLLGMTLTIDDAYGAAFNYGGYTLFAILTGTLIWTIVVNEASPVARLLAVPALVWTGRISYALYLWHLPLFRRFSDNHEVAVMLACFAASFMLAIGSWYFVESPFLRMKSRFRRTPAPQESGGVKMSR